MTYIKDGPSPKKKKHIFSVQDWKGNLANQNETNIQTWDIHSHQKTSYNQELVPFIVKDSQKKSNKVLNRAKHILDNH